ncbi:hypothetical protein OERS_36700 [Oerskovia enterophila]|uniref:Uncharacterized protein n=1 Tax=Oerskovia enterophila TaxID=43678 RepID=A0ABX2Y0G2_9CELL|nr:hypothetical protein OERS_36700 [Oerskovia enterophila]
MKTPGLRSVISSGYRLNDLKQFVIVNPNADVRNQHTGKPAAHDAPNVHRPLSRWVVVKVDSQRFIPIVNRNPHGFHSRNKRQLVRKVH